MAYQQLIDFMRHARDRGMDPATIRVMLGSAGWKDRDIAAAFARDSLQMAIPEPRFAGGARDLFRHLFTFVTLYVLLINLVLLYFGFLDRSFPDPAEVAGRIDDGELALTPVRWSLATVLVAFPVFLGLSRSLVREIAANPEKSRSAARRFFNWLTLFIAAVTALFNLITLLFYFLEGELTPRFLLKVVVLFVISGLVFTYYLRLQHLEDQVTT